jgi:hypothetical protein
MFNVRQPEKKKLLTLKLLHVLFSGVSFSVAWGRAPYVRLAGVQFSGVAVG